MSLELTITGSFRVVGVLQPDDCNPIKDLSGYMVCWAAGSYPNGKDESNDAQEGSEEHLHSQSRLEGCNRA